jgi:DNA-binding SARP family transcriptional activator
MTDGLRSGVTNHPQLTLVTLGTTALRANGDATLFDLGKPLALITYLCCAPDRAAAREHLIDLLWGDVEPDGAKHALRQTLWYIRKRLGDRPMIVGGDVLTVVAPIDSDRDRFLAAVADNSVEDVVRLYTGDFFPGFAAPGGAEFERWADIERQRMRAFFWRAAETVVRRWMTTGRLRDAQALARRVRDSDPLREVGWRLLFETLIAAGDAIGGSLEADAFDRLAEAEGIDAEPATRSMLRAVRQTPEITAQHDKAGERLSLFAELVGREHEFAQLLDQWENARTGTATHVHVLAPAGLGKTRLLTDVHARLRATRARTLFVRASLGARDIPFGLAGDLAEALARFPGASGISTGSARALVALNPALSASYPAALPDSGGDSADALRRRSVAVRELIAAVAEEQPIAIFIDDVQWADGRSRQLIASILGALEHARVLVVTASRPTVDGLSSGEESLTIRLAPLDTTGVQAFVASIAALPSELWAERLPEELCAATGGSPLHLLETLQLAIEGGMLTRADGGWSSPRPSLLFETLGTGGALHQRVERLDRVERWVLTLLAVGGVPLTREVLTAAAGRSDDETASALGSLERRGLVARHGELWSPSHDEIAAKVVELAAPDAIRAAARSLGRVMLDATSSSTRALRHAGGLLAQADDRESLRVAFARFAYLGRAAGDRQPNRALATDFLGERSSDDLATQLVGSLPVLERIGLFSTGRQVAVAAAVAVMPAALLLVGMLRNQPPPDVTLAVGSVGTDSIANVYRVPIHARQLVTGSIVRVGSGRPAWHVHSDPTTGTLVRRPDDKAWTVDRVTTDSGGIDLFDVSDDGRERRLTAAVGDDQSARWSPDGRWLVFNTARWNPESHYDLAILEARSGAVRSLTRNTNTDALPVWSPDGSRIAFDRRYWDGRPRSTCVIDVDGRNERCFAVPGAELSPRDAWYDASHVVVWMANGQSAGLGRLDVSSGKLDTAIMLRRSDEARVSDDGRWVICQCRRAGYSPTAVLLFPLEDPNRVVEIDVSRLNPGRRIVVFESTPRRRRYAERLAIGTGLGAPMVGVPHQLAARGITPDGDTISLGSVLWSSPDTALVTLDGTGLMVAKRPGVVRVMVTAGGWRTAWRDVVVRPRESAVLLQEDWSGALTENWRPFGEPRPRIDSTPDGIRGLMNNGDGSFSSGVYSLAKYPTARGLAVDTWISNRLTLAQWQIVNVSLEDALTDTVLKVWDHGGGNMPRRTVDWPSCSVGYPTTEGSSYGDTIGVVIDRPSSAVTLPAPPSFRSGAWFHVRLQIFPDGRCGVAVNGVAAGRSQFGTIPDSAERVVIFGNSANTKVLVGPLTIRAGVPDDIDWSLPGQPLPAAPPTAWSPRPRL